MPNRNIKESALISEDLSNLSNGAERLFWRLILVADDFGRFDASPPVVKARCFPTMVDSLRTNEVERWMTELEPSLVRFYLVNGRRYGFFLNWEKHQQRRAKYSKFPDPPALDSTCEQLPADALVTETDTEKRNRDTGNGGPPRRGGSDPPGFSEFWTAYPKHVARKDAVAAWQKIEPPEELRVKILAAIGAQKKSNQWLKDGGLYIPYPASWLNARRWEDEVLSAAAINVPKEMPK